MQKWVKNALIGGAAFVAYRLYKLYEMFNSLNWSFQSIRFTRPNIRTIADSYVMNIGVVVNNPTNTALWVNKIDGYVSYDGYVIGNYVIGRVKIEQGNTNLTINLELDPKYVASILIPDLISRKAPIFTIILNAKFMLGIGVVEKFEINVKDYLPEDLNKAIFK
jgi:hypothetical protein